MRIWKSETLPSDLRDAVIVASQEETSQGVGTMGANPYFLLLRKFWPGSYLTDYHQWPDMVFAAT